MRLSPLIKTYIFMNVKKMFAFKSKFYSKQITTFIQLGILK